MAIDTAKDPTKSLDELLKLKKNMSMLNAQVELINKLKEILVKHQTVEIKKTAL